MFKKIAVAFICGLHCFGATMAQSEFEFNHFNVTTDPIFNGNNFKTVAVAKFGKIWAGSQYHGFVIYDRLTDDWRTSIDLRDVSFTDIKATSGTGIWMGHAGKSGLQNGASNTAGGIDFFGGNGTTSDDFYSISSGGGLTSRNVRSIWVDKFHEGPNGDFRVWVAQGTYVSSNITLAGGISVGLNTETNYFTKVYKGLQVTPYVTPPNARHPNCISVAGNKYEVWVCALANFGKSQILRYRSEGFPGNFLGAYDNSNTPVLTSGFRANAMYFDDLGRAWVGMNENGIVIKNAGVWKTMNHPAIFPPGTAVNANAIASDPNGYVYFGTSSGLVIYLGGPVDSAGSYRRVVIEDGLPSNNITGIAADTLGKRMVLTHTAGISFMKFKKKIEASLDWDYSFPRPDIKPKGVAADGVSRLYIKVRRSDSIALTVKKATLTIKNFAASLSSKFGKLKVATVTDKYSNEANTGTAAEVSRTDSTPSGDFYFWYVAPDDFSIDPLSSDALLSERQDSIKVKITYSDDSEDSSYLSIKLQRVPLMLASALTGAKKLFSAFTTPDGVPVLQSDKLGHKLGLQINEKASMLDNVNRLIDGDILQNEDKLNSLQGFLEDFRKQGYAANRIDFVAHGIAGNVMRATAAVKSQKFFADGGQPFNNYGKGYLNKLISIGTPHNGSPVFDALKEFAPKFNAISSKVISNILKNNPDALMPYSFFAPKDSSFELVSELIQKALMDSTAYKLPATQVKNHLIVTDADAANDKPGPLKTFGPAFTKICEQIMMVLRDESPSLKDSITSYFDRLNDVNTKVLKCLEKYAQEKGISNFSSNGDLIGSSAGQAAGQLLTLPHITQFNSTPAEEVTHSNILANKLVAEKVVNLLNTAISNGSFSNTIPANNYISPVSRLLNKVTKVFYDTSKIVTDDRQVLSNSSFRPLAGSSVLSDTSIRLKFRVKDTDGLQYIFINFQDTTYTTVSKEKNQEIILKIKKNILYSGLQEITAVGVYETADSIKYHADTINTFVKVPDSLQGFRVTSDEFDLFDGIPYYPAYEVKINGEWEPLKSSDTAIKITIEDVSKVLYDSSRLAFDASEDGFSRAYFRYKTYRDTVALNCLLPQSLTAVNRTVVNGNFKDSATWSKGRPPLPGDSIIISAGHTIVLDSSVQVRSLRIDSLGSLIINNSNLRLTLGDAEDGAFVIDNYGTLNISNGTLTVRGRVKHNKASTFSMSGGNLVIDGNTGSTVTSLQNGLYLFQAAPQMQSFVFTGGILQIIDPPIGVASQAISCPYNFGINSTLILGDGISFTASENPNGFGGAGFPPQIGRLILDAGTANNNRQLTITQPLNVKGSFEIKTGSNLVIKAQTSVTQ